jgi:hypothetical protein
MQKYKIHRLRTLAVIVSSLIWVGIHSQSVAQLYQSGVRRWKKEIRSVHW